jgi:hypothetical protein
MKPATHCGPSVLLPLVARPERRWLVKAQPDGSFLVPTGCPPGRHDVEYPGGEIVSGAVTLTVRNSHGGNCGVPND